MEDVVSRLERVAAQLEAVHVKVSSGAASVAAPPSKPPGAAAAAPSAAPTSGSVGAYQSLLDVHLAAVADAADAIGGEVMRATRVLADAFTKERDIIAAFAACQQPAAAADLQALLQPTADAIIQAGDLASGPRSPYISHFKLVGEACQALTWVAYSGPSCGMRLPAQHVEDAASAADFYANKVLMEWRAKDPHHATWVTSLKALLTALKEYCGQYFPAGPTWNSGGMPLQGYTPGSTGGAGTAPSKPKAGRAPPPPPPPPPPPGLLDQMAASKGVSAGEGGKSSDGSGGAMAALFAEINKGTAVTSGLKKVTDDMKAKNRAAEERTGTVPAGAVLLKAAAPAPARASAGASAPARLECEQGRKWVVENFSGREDLVVADTEPKQTVYVYNCHRCTVQVRGKVNAITLDKCSKVGLLFDTVVSSCEVVNCTGVQVQFTGLAPTLAVDSSDGCQLFIPQAALQAVELTTAKSSELNVVALAGEGDGEAEPQEWAIPEQFVSRYVGGKFVTEPVQHSAG